MRYINDNHLYSVFFAPRGNRRMAELGMQVTQQYLSPFDRLIGFIGQAGSGKSILIKGMFPGMELVNDDHGVNVRPLPLLDFLDIDDDDNSGFYRAHTYHIDIQFESAFTQKHIIAQAIEKAVSLNKRVVIEHFDLIFPFLSRNADLILGIGEEVIVTRPGIFGPLPHDIADIVFKSLTIRKMAHSAEELCQHVIEKRSSAKDYLHSDVRHGFVLSFEKKLFTQDELSEIENEINELIKSELPISYLDENHIQIGNFTRTCAGPRVHVKSTGDIKNFALAKEFIQELGSARYLLVGLVGDEVARKINDLNKINTIG